MPVSNAGTLANFFDWNRSYSHKNSILLLYSFCQKKGNRKSVQRFVKMMDKLQKNELKPSNPRFLEPKALDFFWVNAIIKANDAGFASKCSKKQTRY
ncbi:hypothetical protein [uncultured Negativibacillus sp.]|uniref:hypothetical protein n=1 Tax=uncultured Negativibacillus sp. TaxID=1980696 RepID=UPI0025D0A784|nr:hypothetical protein [uncultured Negativibacillus sp.]